MSDFFVKKNVILMVERYKFVYYIIKNVNDYFRSIDSI